MVLYSSIDPCLISGVSPLLGPDGAKKLFIGIKFFFFNILSLKELHLIDLPSPANISSLWNFGGDPIPTKGQKLWYSLYTIL